MRIERVDVVDQGRGVPVVVAVEPSMALATYSEAPASGRMSLVGASALMTELNTSRSPVGDGLRLDRDLVAGQ